MAESPPAPAPTPTPPPPTPAPTPVPSPPSPPADDALGENGMRALRAEREARIAAERLLDLGHSGREALEFERRRAEAAERERDELRTRQSTDTANAIQSAQRANTLYALAGLGVTGPKALAAMKLIEGVEYDGNHTPTNLDARLSAAKTTYGEDLFGAPAPPPTPTPPTPTPPTPHPSVHGGPRPPQPEADEDAQFNAHFGHFFGPQVSTANNK